MSTGQKYSGRGNYATTSPQTAKNQVETPNSEDRQPPAFINPRIFQAQTNLLEFTDRFVAAGFEQGPIQAVNALLDHWLSTPAEELSAQDDTDSLHCALLLTDCLSELYQSTITHGEEGQDHV